MYKFIRSLTKIRHLSPIQLREKEIEEELFREKRGTHLLFGRFTEMDIQEEIKKSGIEDELIKKGLHPFEIKIEDEGPFRQKIYIDVNTNEELPSPYSKRIVEILLGECKYVAPELGEIECLTVEWIMLQNPKQKFTEKFPRLPGQRFPGLGIGKLFMMVFENLAKTTGKDCFLAFPEFYHNASMYIDYLYYLHPETHGKVLKMKSDLSSYPLSDVSFAFCGKCILERTPHYEKHIGWEAEEMVYPLKEKLKRYFESEKYKKTCAEAYNYHSYSIDMSCYEIKREELIRTF